MGQKLSISFTGNVEYMKKLKTKPPSEGFLLAWDPVKQKEAWARAAGHGPQRRHLGHCGGLVFSGNSANDVRGVSRRYRREAVAHGYAGRDDGWSVTYEVAGEQYVAVVAGFRQAGSDSYYAPNYSRLLVYKLGGAASLPAALPFTPPVLNPPAAFGTPRAAQAWRRGLRPDVQHLPMVRMACRAACSRTCATAARSRASRLFRSIVIDGVLSKNGMVSFRSAGFAGRCGSGCAPM
ncbi:MAG: hypothetical protein WDO12_13070 [Pseudomonadota bacterium]